MVYIFPHLSIRLHMVQVAEVSSLYHTWRMCEWHDAYGIHRQVSFCCACMVAS